MASLEFADDTPELILKRADQALYCAKRDGRNRGSPTRPKSELRFDRASDSLVGYPRLAALRVTLGAGAAGLQRGTSFRVSKRITLRVVAPKCLST